MSTFQNLQSIFKHNYSSLGKEGVYRPPVSITSIYNVYRPFGDVVYHL